MGFFNGRMTGAIGDGDIAAAALWANSVHPMGNMIDPTTNTLSWCNPTSKYHPVRFNKIPPITEAERRSVRYGFGGGSLPTWYFSPSDPTKVKNNWVMGLPRGGNEVYRITDFEHETDSSIGYNDAMGAPFCVEAVGAPDLNSGYGFILWRNSYAANKLQKSWNATEGITLDEILSGGTDYRDYHFCVLLYDETNPSLGTPCLLIFKWTPRDFGQSDILVFQISHNGADASRPAVPFLTEQSHSGHKVAFVVGLTPSQPAVGHDYDVITDNTISRDVYSLGIVDGCDRISVEFGNSQSILGLEGQPLNTQEHPLRLVNPYTPPYPLDYMVRYQITDAVWAQFITPQNWHYTGWMDISVVFDPGVNAMVIGDASGPGTAGATHTITTSIRLQSAGVTTAQQLVAQSAIGVYFWAWASAPLYARALTVRLVASNGSETKVLGEITITATS